MSHTPGPWRWGNGSYLSLVGRAEGSGSRQVFFGEYGSELENEYDARLIVHAPELLAALRAVTKTDGPNDAEFASAMELLKKLEGV